MIDMITFSCPLILCSFGALFTEYAGCLSLFLDGLVTFSSFLYYTFTVHTGSPITGFLLTTISALIIIFAFSFLVEKLKAHRFIAGTAMNLLFNSLTSCLSSVIFGTRGVLSSSSFIFNPIEVKVFTIVISALLISAAIIFLAKTRYGLYLRITGSDSNVLIAKGVNPSITRILSWCLAGFYSSVAGIILSLRISSFVPNISSGRGWMALAAIFLGRKRPVRMIIAVLIFCAADYFGVRLQNLMPSIPSSVIFSLPYFIALIFATVK